MVSRSWRVPGLVVLGIAAAMALAGCSVLGGWAGPEMSGRDPVAVAASYGRSLVDDHNASHSGQPWHFIRTQETSETSGIELRPGDVERNFDVFAAPGSASATSTANEVDIGTVGVIKKHGQTQWRWEWSIAEDQWPPESD
jgi:hypothetical protein